VLLRSAGREPSPAPGVDEDPVAAFRSARSDIADVLADPVVSGREFEAPYVGRTTVGESVDQVVSADLPLHAWDLARATGQEYAIAAEEIELASRAVRALPEEVLRAPHVFGPEVPVPADASAEDRLLGFLGRDPSWRP
jgi:uncharacterized protein (TIGR03086 family)